MVHRKPVSSLRTLALKKIPRLVKENIVRTAHGTQATWFRVFIGELTLSPEEVLEKHITKFNNYILPNHVWTDREEIFKLVLKGMDDGFQQVRNSWRPEKNHAEYCRVMEAVSKFSEVLTWPKLRTLDFRDVPRSMRSKMRDMIPSLTGLTCLIVGPGNTDGWIPIKGKAASEFSKNLSHLKHLEHFSLKKDCTDDILISLASASSHTIRILDIENSRAVKASSVSVILQCTRIEELNIFGTCIDDEGKARIIMGLTRLKHLVRGDFLCDALGWIDYLEEIEDPVFDIREFTPSQKYFFHEPWQIESLVRMCPRLEKMMFIYHPDSCPSLTPLTDFMFLQELQLHGGDWYSSKINILLQEMGHRLKQLGLIYVKELDQQALAQLFHHCSQLSGVVFNNCEFSQQFNSDGHIVIPSLEELVITSNLKVEYTNWILSSAISLKSVHLGCSTHVNDSTFIEAIDNGGLEYLQDLQVEKSSELTLATMNALIAACPDLKSLGDLGQWSSVTGPELGEVRQIVHEQNLALDLSSNQVLRKYLGMNGEDRKAMMTLMTGPLLERIRIAQGAARIAVERQNEN